METQAMHPGESRTTPGEDIGPITWPVVAAEPGKVVGELDGAGPYAPPAPMIDPSQFHGVYESCQAGLSRLLRIAPDGGGMAIVDLSLRLPANGGHSWEKRSVHFLARVRESWLSEVARGATTRQGQGSRIIAATVALALVPGQHTVAVLEQGLSAKDAAAMLQH